MANSDVLFGDWDKVIDRLGAITALGEANLIKATRRNAIDLRDSIVRAFDEGGPEGAEKWAALKPETIRRKKSSKPLIDHADLRNSINTKVVDKRSTFIGVLKTAKRRARKKRDKGKMVSAEQEMMKGFLDKEPESLINIAKIHEFGAPKAGIVARSFIYLTFALIRDALRDRYRDAAKATVLGQVYRG